MTTERGFWTRAAAVDVCINLRYPAAGETSGIAVRLMGLGKAVIVSDGEEVSGYPAASCLRVGHGLWESNELAHHMTMMAECAGVAEDVGRISALHIRERHSIEAVAGLYWKVLCACRN